MSKTLALQPRISEKSYALSATGVYVFDVPLSVTKHSVKRAIEAQYSVGVTEVRTVVLKGKVKRLVRKRQQPKLGSRSDAKKAYVTLKKGDRITVFPEAE